MAENTADASDLDGAGCGGFPWSRMSCQTDDDEVEECTGEDCISTDEPEDNLSCMGEDLLAMPNTRNRWFVE